jgi:hypothetical protein
VGELAVGAVDLAPLLEQPQDLGDLPVQQAVHRAATGRLVLELAGGAAAQPPIDAQLADLQHLASPAHRPTLPAGLLEQVQQPGLVAASTRGGTRPLSPNAHFPPPAPTGRPTP